MDERRRCLKRGRRVETLSLIYNVVEVVVSLTAGILSGSAALISWGLDSTIEGASAATMIWRLRGDEAEMSPRDLAWRRKIALTVVATAFWIVVAFILSRLSASSFRRRRRASPGSASASWSCPWWSTRSWPGASTATERSSTRRLSGTTPRTP